MKHLLFSLVLAGSLFSLGTPASGQDTSAEVTALLEREAADLNIREVALLQAEVRSLRAALARAQGEGCEVEPIVEVAAVEEHGPCPLESLAQLAGKPFECEGHESGEPTLLVANETLEAPVVEEAAHEHGAAACALSKLAALAGEPACDARFEAAPILASAEPIEIVEPEPAPEPVVIPEPVLVLEPVEVEPIEVEPIEVVEPVVEVEEPVEQGANLIQAALEPFWAASQETAEACQDEVVVEEPAACEAAEEPIACTLAEEAQAVEEACVTEVEAGYETACTETQPLPESLIGAQIELAVVRAKIAKAKSELAAIEAELEAARSASSCGATVSEAASVSSVNVGNFCSDEVVETVESVEACVVETTSCETGEDPAEAASSCEASAEAVSSSAGTISLSDPVGGVLLASVTNDFAESSCTTATLESTCTGPEPVIEVTELVVAAPGTGCEKETTSSAEPCHKLERAHEELLAGRAELAELQALLETKRKELASLRTPAPETNPLDSRVSLRVR